jgi:(2Fe-2S) ferredoxin
VTTRLDIWVCQGRMCTANGSDAVATHARAFVEEQAQGGTCRVLRGGCYGHCEIGPNVVVRAHEGNDELPDVDVDRLSLTEEANETVYSGMAPADIALVVKAHLAGRSVPALTRDARLAALPAASPVAEKIRALRARRRAP